MTQITERPQQYRGRFAPSPSGNLHFGSLISALASFLDARKHNGSWLVRIEDIDPPREQVGASDAILHTLDAYGLHWDEQVFYQSQQTQRYQALIQQLFAQQQCYYCQCTRAQIKASGGIYQGHCRDLALPADNNAIRVINPHGIATFNDLIQGEVHCDALLAQEDFIILRKDGLFAYQLAVVADDIFQQITHVVRGCDLLEPSCRQLSFYRILNANAPQFAHVPLAVTSEGYKLSKQNKAPAIDNHKPQPSLIAALNFLGQQPPTELISYPVADIINWAIKHWQIVRVPKKQQIAIS
ncbi:glutamyl-Q tRNA(Asp) synthetase [Thalassotalea insulae]|uniref:Glutamyl-Q tRNA(Asp) synthetase n=1 Tax=Thalassotalea insulae TaxID=2056778 RepID=A0ABQ6GST3_9GAMM|nr:tRNA glutamyl-Q(34) synthetase GluQRS [Thalassotalea insulae]GLX79008.1 glutamyl-Q tRNA(Asp) synthetase [Thalassotalea insulae]